MSIVVNCSAIHVKQEGNLATARWSRRNRATTPQSQDEACLRVENVSLKQSMSWKDDDEEEKEKGAYPHAARDGKRSLLYERREWVS